jgi:2-oxoglutarate ferredoxin oxidoreductase subunit beta
MSNLAISQPNLDLHQVQRSITDYESGTTPRWCSGCGDHGILNATKQLLQEYNEAPENVVFVSGIGCSSRFPHYLSTYGFHGIHGRAIPIATGIALTRPDLKVFVVTGDGDCCSIGAAHWVHGMRYNTNMTILLLDNEIYGLTKKQTSPTTKQDFKTNTQPQGSYLPALKPLSVAVSVSNASFVARTADFVPQHLLATLRKAHEHKGTSFIQILQRCPVFNEEAYQPLVKDKENVVLLEHEDGIPLNDSLKSKYTTRQHNPRDISAAFTTSLEEVPTPLGLIYYNPDAPCYDEIRQNEIKESIMKKADLNEQFKKFEI